MPVRRIDAATLKARLHDGAEIALLDAREEVPFDLRHILMAACVPLGRVETIVGDSVPRQAARVVWCDDGEGLAQRAAERMTALPSLRARHETSIRQAASCRHWMRRIRTGSVSS